MASFAQMPTHTEAFTVSGIVYNPNGRPAPALEVHAFNRDLRTAQRLGVSKTDKRGAYLIHYTTANLPRTETGSADVMLRIFKHKEEVYKSPFDDIVFNAPKNVVIDVHLKVGDTAIEDEFNAILKAIAPLLDGSEVKSPSSFREDDDIRDVSFLAKELGIDALKIGHIAVSYKLADRIFMVRPHPT
jgi:hypothetical protein